MNNNKTLLALALTALGFTAFTTQAATVYEQGNTSVDINVEAGLGIFHSGNTYNTVSRSKDESVTWHESYLMLDLEAAQQTNVGTFYGGVGTVLSTTGGDGDAAGFTTGSEGKITLENLFAGWKSGDLIPALGNDGLEVSFGRQQFVVGDGFIINSDALSFGKGLEPYVENRGGSYYMAPRRSFDNTVILSIGSEMGLKAQAFYLDSGNEGQDEIDMTGVNLEYNQDWGTVGLLAVKNDSDLNSTRDGQKVYSLRYQGNAGVENLFLSTEFAKQSQGDSSKDGTAAYLELGWTFADVAMSPSVNYRYSHFSETYDPLMFGFSRDFGTWFQGEVAANYAGPFSSNANIQLLSFRAQPLENLGLGVNFFNFKTDKKSVAENLDANEVDIFMEYFPTDYLMVSPLVGLYKPSKDDSEGGTQIGSNDLNVYGQLMLVAFF